MDLLGQSGQIPASQFDSSVAGDFESLHDIVKGRRHQEVFLFQTKLFAFEELKVTHSCYIVTSRVRLILVTNHRTLSLGYNTFVMFSTKFLSKTAST